MKEIIDWLSHFEKMVGLFYKNAAEIFQDDLKLSGFLQHLSRDEYLHYHIITKAAECIEEKKDFASSITLDKETKKKIEAPFKDNEIILSKGNLSKEKLIELVASSELSEWNDIFLYVMNTLKERKKEFMDAAAKMQQHRDYIVKFVESLPYGNTLLNKFQNLQPLWHKRVLIVDDTSSVTRLLSIMFKKEFIVETAENGKEGLKKTNGQRFDAIISDINMPIMNGLDFFNEAVKKEPDIGKRFLFFSGAVDQELSDFFDANHLDYIEKPASINTLRLKVAEILRR